MLQLCGGVSLLGGLPDSRRNYEIAQWLVCLVALFTRVYRVENPSEVVFDETHFGRFASLYLQREWFFDLHPPLAKLWFALLGYMSNYDGSFQFEQIGDSYIADSSIAPPYILYRLSSVVFGVSTVFVMFKILKQLNLRASSCFFGCLLVSLDNAQILSSRLIMLDAMLIWSIALTTYCYIRFYKYQCMQKSFTFEWYQWLLFTGISLSCTISIKYVGVFTYGFIGTAVILNLWQLLDFRFGLTIRLFMRHLIRRLNILVFVPFIIYLSWFAIHFQLLVHSSEDAMFMSEEFQDTLIQSTYDIYHSPVVKYYDIVTLRHTFTEAFLNSKDMQYPFQYKNGRVSSQNNIVVASNDKTDDDNIWQIIPAGELESYDQLQLNDMFRLKHINTDKFLCMHDVASPLSGFNEEVTTIHDRTNETIFQFKSIREIDQNHLLKANRSLFQLYSPINNRVAWTHNEELLPEWSNFTQEICGIKDFDRSDLTWMIYDIINYSSDNKEQYDRIVPNDPNNSKLSFFEKWTELQLSMFAHNNELTSEHIYASQPWEWPFSLRGVLYWTKNAERRQIYFIGNIVGYWVQITSILIFAFLILIDIFTQKRGIKYFNNTVRDRLYGPNLFLLSGWLWHYLPFFLMNRQKFLHHYLPAHMLLSLFTATVLDTLSYPLGPFDIQPRDKKRKIKHVVTLLVFTVGLTYFYQEMIPITYGNSSLTPAEVSKRQWLSMQLAYAT